MKKSFMIAIVLVSALFGLVSVASAQQHASPMASLAQQRANQAGLLDGLKIERTARITLEQKFDKLLQVCCGTGPCLQTPQCVNRSQSVRVSAKNLGLTDEDLNKIFQGMGMLLDAKLKPVHEKLDRLGEEVRKINKKLDNRPVPKSCAGEFQGFAKAVKTISSAMSDLELNGGEETILSSFHACLMKATADVDYVAYLAAEHGLRAAIPTSHGTLRLRPDRGRGELDLKLDPYSLRTEFEAGYDDHMMPSWANWVVGIVGSAALGAAAGAGIGELVDPGYTDSERHHVGGAGTGAAIGAGGGALIGTITVGIIEAVRSGDRDEAFATFRAERLAQERRTMTPAEFHYSVPPKQ